MALSPMRSVSQSAETAFLVRNLPPPAETRFHREIASPDSPTPGTGSRGGRKSFHAICLRKIAGPVSESARFTRAGSDRRRDTTRQIS